MANAGPLECFATKLGRLTKGLQSWGQCKVGNIKQQLAMAKDVVHRLEIAQDTRQLSDEEAWLRRNLKKILSCLGVA